MDLKVLAEAFNYPLQVFEEAVEDLEEVLVILEDVF